MRYEGVVFLSGSSVTAWATIDDTESPSWRGAVRGISAFDFQRGLVTVKLAEGDADHAFSVAELRYDEEAERYDGAPGTLAGGTPFGPEPERSVWRPPDEASP